MDIQQLKSYKILLLGESCLDVYHYGTCDRLNPEAPVPVLKENKLEIKSGMAANVKANLKSLGLSVSHLTNKEKLEKHRLIDTRFNCHIARYDIGESEKIKPLDTITEDFDILVISDYNKGFITPSFATTICEAYKDKTILVDSKKQDLSCYKNCILKINEKEFRECVDIDDSCELIVTLGDKGAYYKSKLYETDKTEVFDVCGAGDTFMASFTMKYLYTKSIDESITFANEVCSDVVNKKGVSIPDRKFRLK